MRCASNLVLQNQPNNSATSNADEDDRISDDEFICNAQMSSDSIDDLNAENYQMTDERDIETDSDICNVYMPFENLRADDENDCLQNIPNYDDDNDGNNRSNNELEQVYVLKCNIFCF